MLIYYQTIVSGFNLDTFSTFTLKASRLSMEMCIDCINSGLSLKVEVNVEVWGRLHWFQKEV